jgi:hypothetical protein
MASGLIATVLLAIVGGPVPLTGQPAPPPTSSVLADRATVACLDSMRQKPAFAPFEQAAAAAGMPTARTDELTRHQGAGRLRMAHGRDCSRAVKRREAVTSRRYLAPTYRRSSPTERRVPLRLREEPHTCQAGMQRTEQRAKTAIDRSQNGSSGSAIMAQCLALRVTIREKKQQECERREPVAMNDRQDHLAPLAQSDVR